MSRQVFSAGENKFSNAGKIYSMTLTYQRGFYQDKLWRLEELEEPQESRVKNKIEELKRNGYTNVKTLAGHRSFFGPRVWCWDEKSVIISYKLTPNAKDTTIQSLDAKNGVVQWSQQIPNQHNDFTYVNDGVLNQDEVILSGSGDAVIILDRMTGKINYTIPAA